MDVPEGRLGLARRSRIRSPEAQVAGARTRSILGAPAPAAVSGRRAIVAPMTIATALQASPPPSHASSRRAPTPRWPRATRRCPRRVARRRCRLRGRDRVPRRRDDRLRPAARPRSSRSRSSSRAGPRSSSASRRSSTRAGRSRARRRSSPASTTRCVAGAPADRRRSSSASLEFVGDARHRRAQRAFDRAFVLGRPRARAGVRAAALARLARARAHRAAAACAATGCATSPRRSASPQPAHRAADDVEALFRIWRIALAGPRRTCRPRCVAAIAELAPETDWPLRETLAHARPRAAAPRALDLQAPARATRARGRSAPRRSPTPTSASSSCPEPDEVLAEFAAEGAGRAGCTRASSRASEQLEMAEAVLEAFGERAAPGDRGGHRRRQVDRLPRAGGAVRAGEPRGRRRRDQDERAHGPARLRRAAARSTRRSAASCATSRSRATSTTRACASSSGSLDELDGRADRETLATVAALLAWIAQSSWGDLDAINLHWAARRARGRSACSAEDCTRKRCRFYPNLCYLHGVRRRAASRAHRRHQPRAALPRRRRAGRHPAAAAVLDRRRGALRRERGAQAALAVGASHRALAGAARRRCTPRAAAGCSTRCARRLRARAARGDEELAARVERLATQLRGEVATARDDRRLALRLPEGPAPLEEPTATTAPSCGSPPALRETGPSGACAAGVGRSLAQAARRGRSPRARADDAARGGGRGARRRARRPRRAALAARRAARGLVAVLDGEDDSLRLQRARLDRRRDDTPRQLVGRDARRRRGAARALLPATCTRVVFTSATIATGDDFEHFARTVGLDRLPEGAWRVAAAGVELRLRAADGGVRARPTCPSRAGGGYLGELERRCSSGVHVAMGGSVLTLFTNRRDMEQLYDACSRRRSRSAACALLLQGRGRVAQARCATSSSPTSASRCSRPSRSGRASTRRATRCAASSSRKLPFGRAARPALRGARARDGRARVGRLLPARGGPRAQAGGGPAHPQLDRRGLPRHRRRPAVVRKGYARGSWTRCRSATSRCCRPTS